MKRLICSLLVAVAATPALASQDLVRCREIVRDMRALASELKEVHIQRQLRVWGFDKGDTKQWMAKARGYVSDYATTAILLTYTDDNSATPGDILSLGMEMKNCVSGDCDRQNIANIERRLKRMRCVANPK